MNRPDLKHTELREPRVSSCHIKTDVHKEWDDMTRQVLSAD